MARNGRANGDFHHETEVSRGEKRFKNEGQIFEALSVSDSVSQGSFLQTSLSFSVSFSFMVGFLLVTFVFCGVD